MLASTSVAIGRELQRREESGHSVVSKLEVPVLHARLCLTRALTTGRGSRIDPITLWQGARMASRRASRPTSAAELRSAVIDQESQKSTREQVERRLSEDSFEAGESGRDQRIVKTDHRVTGEAKATEISLPTVRS